MPGLTRHPLPFMNPICGEPSHGVYFQSCCMVLPRLAGKAKFPQSFSTITKGISCPNNGDFTCWPTIDAGLVLQYSLIFKTNLMSEQVLSVTAIGVDVDTTTSQAMLIINAKGVVPSGGYTNGTLVLSRQTHSLLEYKFMADPPAQPAPALLSVIQAKQVIIPFPVGVNTIRVHAKKNSWFVLM
jgi:hypothetical protein